MRGRGEDVGEGLWGFIVWKVKGKIWEKIEGVERGGFGSLLVL